ncbi:hypothetical protein [Amycolatopsis thermoflava]|uniref:Uncharacterized protein n=1 Tax=Amycolatopsis thermoflava TaxID=84480 RepID=A0A3N2HAL3_9PSEU|nr:hypothetical protein [Amycolatopsis thermoflava]ROS45145.1 hypothetical protein EDD35_7605 [Amycolatopsis thermoflava]
MEERGWRPRWWLFAVFAVVATVHLAGGGWDSTTAVGLPVGFAATLVLVFVRRLPNWVTGEWDSRPWSRSWVRASRNRTIVALPFALLGVVAVLIGLADHPPHGTDVLYAAFVAALAVGLVVVLVVRWGRAVRTLRLLAGPRTALPARFDDGSRETGTVTFPDGARAYFTLHDPPRELIREIEHAATLHVTSAAPGKVLAGQPGGDEFARATLRVARATRTPSRSSLKRRLRLRTVAFAAVVAAGVALEGAAVVLVGGALPWVLAAPILLAVGATALWRARVARAVRLLAAGPWTSITAATMATDVDGPVSGWVVFPDGLRGRFHIEYCPPDVAAELLRRRRLWVAGAPRPGDVAVGLPEGDTFAIAWLAVTDRRARRLDHPRF